ncbi:MAG: NYN domain-containing protein [Thermogemmatispora sp.]|uniref:NYN domain-containing protein n=1 Tax=Thermogemmatispora sp. TaxID=1968838 RepID=UPI002616DE84|nr:NYN domain-containing protein [Thermogemmatispora sp.]MBX5456345.1 NYN domain-containing protein [Thermogemmatispora sp.]
MEGFLPFSEGNVRPFSEFIEEFRQAEEARQAATFEAVHEALDALSTLNTLGNLTSPAEDESSSSAALSASSGPLSPLPTVAIPGRLSFVESSSSITVSSFATGEMQAESLAPAPSSETTPGAEGGAAQEQPEPASPAAEERSAKVEEEPQSVAQTSQTSQAPAAPEKPAERPPSPLLRPATRIRLPRYGRLREPFVEERLPSESEKSTEEESQPAAAASTQAGGEPAPASSGPGTGESGSAETTAPASEEGPVTRPARRYRFDRPATAANSAMFLVNSSQQSTSPEQQRETGEKLAAAGTSAVQEERRPEIEQSQMVAAPSQPLEETYPLSSREMLNEQRVEEQRSKQQSKNNRQQEKEKEEEQPAAPVALPVQPTANGARPAAQETQVPAPEDLPPLEYSEIQAATSRRRRRRRSKSAAAASAPAPATEPTPPPIAPPPMPVSPVTVPPVTQPASASVSQPTAPAGLYHIISGTTMNQMNLGNEFGGPFMAPEPSPARGSVAVREAGVRPSRSDVQRNNLVYPSNRGNDPMAQFANTVVQAIQSQTDRIVAELRRTNQSPTNVSVSIPPPPSTERVGVFVDVANLLYSARTLRLTIDFGKLLDFLRGNRRLVRAHAYCPTSPQPGDEQMFLQAVKGLGYRITTKNYKTFSSGAKKADLDLDLCMDVVRLVESRAVDCIVLVSGDSDFMPMLDYCSDHGVRVEVAAFDEAMSATLRQSCDLFINLSVLEEIRA